MSINAKPSESRLTAESMEVSDSMAFDAGAAEKVFALYVSLEDVFPEADSGFETFRTLFGGLSQTDTIFWCARINRIVSEAAQASNAERQARAISYFTTPRDARAIQDALLSSGKKNKQTVFFRGQLLEIVRWACLLCKDKDEDGTTFRDPQTVSLFLQAALMASDIWGRRVYGGRLSLKDGIVHARKRTLAAARKASEGAANVPPYNQTIGRGWLLFNKYLPKFWNTFCDDFVEATGMDFRTYYVSHAAAMTLLSTKQDSGIINVGQFGRTTAAKAALDSYLTIESQTIDELKTSLWGDADCDMSEEGAPPYDYRPFRERPILRTPDGRGIISDPVFMSERASIGPLFTVAGINRSRSNELFSAWGCAVEDYVTDILQRIYPHVEGLADRLLTREHGADIARKQLEVDACIDDVKELFFIEIKSAVIREADVMSDDYDRYEVLLREKYGLTFDDDGSPRAKGVAQLVRIISAVIDRAWLGPDGAFDQARVIWPILLVHDPYLSTFGHSRFLAEEFQNILNPDLPPEPKPICMGETVVQPLIVMTIETLESLESSIESFSLLQTLRDYNTVAQDRTLSFHDFIASSRYNDLLKANRSLAEATAEVYRDCCQLFFPDKPLPQSLIE